MYHSVAFLHHPFPTLPLTSRCGGERTVCSVLISSVFSQRSLLSFLFLFFLLSSSLSFFLAIFALYSGRGRAITAVQA